MLSKFEISLPCDLEIVLKSVYHVLMQSLKVKSLNLIIIDVNDTPVVQEVVESVQRSIIAGGLVGDGRVLLLGRHILGNKNHLGSITF